MSDCYVDGSYCPLVEYQYGLVNIPCRQCKRFSNHVINNLHSLRLGSVSRQIILEAMDPIKVNPFRTLSEQSARRRALYQLIDVGLIICHKDNAGSWEYRTAHNGRFEKKSYRLSLVPLLTAIGESIADLIADDIKHNKKISWKNVIKQLPPDGVGLGISEVKALWIEWINKTINNRYEIASLDGMLGNHKAYAEQMDQVMLLRKQIAALEALDLTTSPDGLGWLGSVRQSV